MPHFSDVFFVRTNHEHSERIFQILEDRKTYCLSLSKATGIARALLGMEENPPPYPFGNLVLIADYLNCSVDYLLGRTEDPELHPKITAESQISANSGPVRWNLWFEKWSTNMAKTIVAIVGGPTCGQVRASSTQAINWPTGLHCGDTPGVTREPHLRRDQTGRPPLHPHRHGGIEPRRTTRILAFMRDQSGNRHQPRGCDRLSHRHPRSASPHRTRRWRPCSCAAAPIVWR